MPYRLTLTLCLTFAVAFPLRAQSPAAPTSDLPVRTVVLFSSGVGYFEHGGNVTGNGAAELRFKTAQINDVLKSLTLQDLDGGRVSTVTYPSQDPIARTLRSFQVDITGNPGMADLLNQLRGARVTVAAGGQQLHGTVLGVETREKAGAGEAVSTSVLNVFSGATIRSIELSTITGLSLDDPTLQAELTRALAALSRARDQDKKTVSIDFSGSGSRRLRVGYVVETPIWKTSYRLILDGKSARLQGWAIVENQTESDWNNVALSLVSGRPISFIMDLYAPLYLQRPVVVPEYFTGLRPQVYQDGVPAAPHQNALVPRDQVAAKALVGASSFEDASITTGRTSSEFGNAQGGVIAITGKDNAVQSAATAAQLGELFQYSIPNVTLSRQQSAMLPIVTDSVGIDRVSIYNAGVLPRNPLYGVRLRNTTGMHLLQGPVTVLEQGSYAGDAQIDNVPPGQSRLLSYGIDLELLIDSEQGPAQSEVVSARIVQGVMTVEHKSVTSREYRIDNKGSREKSVMIEHPTSGGWQSVGAVKPVETTPTLARFETVAPAGKVTTLKVEQEQVRQQTIAMVNSNSASLLLYSRTGEISNAVRDALSRAIELKQALESTERDLSEQTQQIASITEEQVRIRENLKSIDAKSQYAERLLSKLDEQESAIERFQAARKALTEKRDAQRAELDKYLNGLTIG